MNEIIFCTRYPVPGIVEAKNETETGWCLNILPCIYPDFTKIYLQPTKDDVFLLALIVPNARVTALGITSSLMHFFFLFRNFTGWIMEVDHHEGGDILALVISRVLEGRWCRQSPPLNHWSLKSYWQAPTSEQTFHRFRLLLKLKMSIKYIKYMRVYIYIYISWYSEQRRDVICLF